MAANGMRTKKKNPTTKSKNLDNAEVQPVRYIEHTIPRPFGARNYPDGVDSLNLRDVSYDIFYSRYLAGRCPVLLRGFDPDW